MFSIGTADHNKGCYAHVFRWFRVRFGDCGDCLARRRWCSLSGCFYHCDVVVVDVSDDNHHVGSNQNEAASESGARALSLIHGGVYIFHAPRLVYWRIERRTQDADEKRENKCKLSSNTSTPLTETVTLVCRVDSLNDKSYIDRQVATVLRYYKAHLKRRRSDLTLTSEIEKKNHFHELSADGAISLKSIATENQSRLCVKGV